MKSSGLGRIDDFAYLTDVKTIKKPKCKAEKPRSIGYKCLT
jgi:hypothetical protein